MAALTSAVLPGWGHMYADRREIGRKLLIVDGVAAGVGIVALLMMRTDVLKLWVTTTALAVMMVFNLALLGYRWLVATDAYQSMEDVGDPRWLTNAVLGTAALLIVVPHVVFGYFTVVQYGLIETVFGRETPVATVAPTNPPPATSDPAVVPIGGTSTTPASTTTTTIADPVLWDGLERLNIVLLGADAGEGRRGLRTDTTIVVSLDPETGNTAMFSVPRDLSSAPLPDGMGIWDCNCFPDLITHLYDAAERNPEAFPGPGEPPFNAIKGALSEIFGIPIHYYAMVTLDGFVDVVDALGGVTIEIPEDIVDETYPHEDGTTVRFELDAGIRHLNGHEALAYARTRRHSDDFSRMNRQRCVLEAVVEQSSPTEILFRFGAIADAMKRSLVTDIPQERLVDFVDLVPKVSTDRISTLRITRDVYKTGSSPGRTYYDIDQIRADSQLLMSDPERAFVELGLEDLDSTCGVDEG